METLSKKDEPARLTALQRYKILDTPQDGSFNRLTSLAAKMFNVPIAIISLVDTDRIWFKSHYGLEADQIDRDPGLCDSAIMSDELYIIEDAKNDPRTLANPLVASDFGLRFYAGAPLQTHDGYNLGTFCIIDRKQRFLNESQKGILAEMAAITMDEIELRLAARRHTKKNNSLLKETVSVLKSNAVAFGSLTNACKTSTLEDQINENKVLLTRIESHLQ